jgi:thiamine monophosphate kinase
MMRRMIAFLATVAAMSGYAVYAHHSFAAAYLEDQELGIEGTVTQFMFRNPHSFVRVTAFAKGDRSKTQHPYVVEWGGGGQLTRMGVSRDTLKAGDYVVITGSPGRNAADHRLRMKSIVRPKDGWKWKGVVE